MKIYVLILSEVFPKTHVRAGELTGFRNNLRKTKIHTIRTNIELWRKRFQKIECGEAELSIRQWVGKPYGKGSTQKELCRLTREDGIGIQKMTIEGCTTHHQIFIDGIPVSSKELANNDGLDEADWHSWFRGYDVTEPMAVIHFTKFRY